MRKMKLGFAVNFFVIILVALVFQLSGTAVSYAGTWTAQTDIGTSILWKDVAISGDGSTLIAATAAHGLLGELAKLFISRDGGETWDLIDSISTSSGTFYDVSLSNDGQYILTSTFGNRLYVSRDYGETWTDEKTNSSASHDTAVSPDGSIMVAGVTYSPTKGNGGELYLSTDYGDNWSTVSSGVVKQFWYTFDILADNQTIFAASGRQIITASPLYFYISSDGGTTWATSTFQGRDFLAVRGSADGSTILSVDARNSTATGTVDAFFEPGYVHVSTDGGTTFSSTTLGLKKWVGGAISSDGQKMVVADNTDDAGSVYYSEDSGQTWTEMDGAGNRDWVYIDASDDLTRIIVADDGGYVYVYNNPPTSDPVDDSDDNTRSSRKSSTSASSRVRNLIAQGNISLAQQVAQQYGVNNIIASVSVPGCPAGMICTPVSNSNSGPNSGPNNPSRFNRNLEDGAIGDDVRELQQYLNSKGFTLALSGPGSLGNETTIFGPLTRSALARFQSANNISPAVGFFGPITRAFIQANP